MSLSYRLQTNEKLPQGIIRIAQEQIDDALDYLAKSEDDLAKAVYESCNCFKKAHGRLRLMPKPGSLLGRPGTFLTRINWNRRDFYQQIVQVKQIKSLQSA